MTPATYLAALYVAGIPRGLPVHELDRRAAEMLKINVRTARRYRWGETRIPDLVEVALTALARPRPEQP